MNLDVRHVEYGLIVTIFFVLVFVFRSDKEPEPKWEDPIIVEEEFSDNPIVAWRSV